MSRKSTNKNLDFLMNCGSTKSFCDFITFLNVSFVFKFYRLLYLEHSYLFCTTVMKGVSEPSANGVCVFVFF